MQRSTKARTAAAVGAVVVFAALTGVAAAMNFTLWGTPVNAESVAGTSSDLNTPLNEGCPMQSPDGLSLYMASNRPGGLGGQDIWVARRTSKHAPFGAPVNLDAPVNSAADDFCPTPLRGRRLLFVSARAGGCGGPDIYLTRRDDAQGWEAPANLGCQVNSAFGEAGPSLVRDADGRRALYFSSNRP